MGQVTRQLGSWLSTGASAATVQLLNTGYFSTQVQVQQNYNNSRVGRRQSFISFHNRIITRRQTRRS